ncbi:MAG: hypothetical protein OH338_01255 [Candidatus Parvarchaeota archaeon]|nr:hypothetical protein [Candidatus Parvarchaeota archaeon]MCW1294873.1 hypothetical protein [Candidatus Parvarchaeum tengchongense]MCW1295701.1 hypothetical protein [Candidatus Parvarchaeum tengchongense]MCW1298750.1 hypothetical protein [Candidatus Parvarchaeum tengchongense]MCW1312042.1 hypothetical protein [Candidatus Parvarchaeum tengchongense]
MHLKEKISGFANVLAITFAVFLMAMETSLFVSSIQVRRSFTWLFKRIISLKAEKV